MKLQERIDAMMRLGEALRKQPDEWTAAKDLAFAHNQWFTPEFIELAVDNIIQQYLAKDALLTWADCYGNPEPEMPKTVGLTMAGNIPLVGFHDMLSVFISGHKQMIKPSSKDSVLLQYVLRKLLEIAPDTGTKIMIAETLKGCDAYIATGGNQSARYFEFYFSKYPHIIRPNKTSVAVLTGKETRAELDLLADDIHLFFGLGCRNVTKIMVPINYDFTQLMDAMKKYAYFKEHHKYSNNYDYRLAVLLLGKTPFITNEHLLLVESESPFSPISMLHYEYYDSMDSDKKTITDHGDIQCVVGINGIGFGQAQRPSLTDYADGVDTMAFLKSL